MEMTRNEKAGYRYTVRCEFHGPDIGVIDRWLAWLRDPHIADVMDGGATSAEIIKMNGQITCYEIRYRFASESDFRRYEQEFAPALKQEGLRLFPPDENQMVYSRTHGQVVFDT